MTFLHAGLLAAGVAAVSIPILIHLLMRRRRKPVQWGAMRFLLEAYKRTRRRLLIQRWMLLAARCLLIALIAIALGRPILGLLTGERVGGRTVYLLVDNSLASSATQGSDTPPLARHLEAARATLSTLGDGDRAGLVLLGSPAERVVMPPTANLGALRQVLEQVVATDARADIPGALAAVGAAITESRSRGNQADAPNQTFVLLLSDLYRGSADTDAALPRLPSGVSLLAARHERAPPLTNVSVRSATPMRSIMLGDQLDQSQSLTVELLRSASTPLAAAVSRVTLRMEASGGPAGAPSAGDATVNWSAGQREAAVTVVLNPPGPAASAAATQVRLPGVVLAQVDRDAIAGDNTFRVPVDMRETLRVGIIGSSGSRSARAGDPEALQGSDWVALALRPREDVAVEVVDLEPGALDTARLAGLDAVIITAPDRVPESEWPRLRQFAEAGGAGGAGGTGGGGGAMLIVTPPGDRSVHTWTDAMLRGLGLSWAIAREARLIDPSDPGRPRVVRGEVGSGPSLLQPLQPEMPDLVRSVNILKLLPLVGPAEGATLELALSDGTGLVWATSLGAEARRPAPDGDPTASVRPRSRGIFVYIACSLDLKWSDLPVKPLMVPLMQELVRQGVGRARPATSAVAGQIVVTPAQTARLRPWAAPQSAPSAEGATAEATGLLMVDEWGYSARPLRHAGVWDAIDAGGGRRGIVAVNADFAAGDVTPLEAGAVQAWLNRSLQSGQMAWVSPGDSSGGQAIRTALAARTEGRPTTALLLIAALVLAAVEMALARWASN